MPIRRGQVYFVDLSPTVGREQHGRRPVVVVSNDTLNSMPLVVTVVPGTSRARVGGPYPWNVAVPAGEANLPLQTVFLTFQVRALDPSRFQDPCAGELTQSSMDQLDRALVWVLALSTGQATP